MTSRTRTISLPPAAVLALSVLLCGGAFTEPATAALLLQHADEAASAGTDPLRGASRGAGRNDRKAVASLLSCLADAAKQLQNLQDRQHGCAAALSGVRQVPPVATRPPAPAASERAMHPLRDILPQHLDLPPPAATL